MKNKTLHIILLLTTLFSFAYGQNQTIKQADKLFEQKQFFSASYLYKNILDNQFDARIAYKYAEACRLDYNFAEAEKYYKQIIYEDTYLPVILYFHLAEVQKGQGKYLQAKRNFNKFINLYTENDFFKIKAKHEILSCEEALKMSFEPEKYTIEHCKKLNTVHGELKILWSDSVKLFTRFVESKNDSSKTLAKLFCLKNDSVFQINIPGHSNDDIPSFALSKKTHKIYLSICSNNLNGRRCKIWKAGFNNCKISNLSELPSMVNFPGSNAIQPSISSIGDKEYMFFASDRQGGQGRYDIWVSELYEDGNPSAAKNLGKKINSIDDEIAPFYDSQDEILYFSSKWYSNLGGFDIFKSSGNIDYWDETENAGTGINSSYNDYYFNISGDSAYFSSNRKGALIERGGLCCNDFYKFKIRQQKQESFDKLAVQQSIRQLIPITLYFHNDEPNPKTRDTSTNLTYEQTYLKYINMIQEYENEYSAGLQGADKMKAKEEINSFFETEVSANYIKLRKFTYLLKKLLENGEQIKITIKGFASPLNTNDYNTNLSKRRIQSLVNYFEEVDNGFFRKYMQSNDNSEPLLVFERIAFGEDKADTNISDSYTDVRNSVYSPKAAYERKIKVLAVSFGKK